MWTTLLSTMAMMIAKKAASFLWEVLWKIVAASIVEAEKNWEKTGCGEVKKQWVLDHAMEYVEQNMKLNAISKWVVKTFISKIIDQIIEKLNDQFKNHKWVDYVSDLKIYIEKYLPK